MSEQDTIIENDWSERLNVGRTTKCPECGRKMLDKDGLCWWRDCHYHTPEAWRRLDLDCALLGEPLMYPDAPSRPAVLGPEAPR